jgi:DNA-binding beta-propeller fold protein YncE
LCIEGDTLWITLREGHSVWRMSLADGVLHHVAGTGVAGYSGDGGPALQATFNGPKGIAVGSGGQAYVADSENDAIRRIDLATGKISTVAGGGAQEQLAADDGGVESNQRLNRPHGVCVGPGDEVFVGDTLSHRVRRIR